MFTLFRRNHPSQTEEDGETAIHYLIQSLQSSDREVRCEALKVLRLTIGTPVRKGAYAIQWSRIAASLQQTLLQVGMMTLHDHDAEVRQQAAQLLAEIQISPSFLKNLRHNAPAIDIFMTLLEDQQAVVRREAAHILGQLADRRAIPPLVRTLGDQQKEVRQAAATALRKLQWRPLTRADLIAYNFAMERWKALLALGTPVLDYLPPYSSDENTVMSYTLRSLCDSITTVIFGANPPPDFSSQTVWLNPEVATFSHSLPRLTTVCIVSNTFDFYQVERFITYAVNSIGQAHLHREVRVEIYGRQDAQYRQLWNALTNLCQTVCVHPASAFSL
jgi:HEAT repeat protein